MIEPMFIASLLFLTGLLMMSATVFARVRELYPGVFKYGVWLTFLSIGLAVAIAFLSPASA